MVRAMDDSEDADVDGTARRPELLPSDRRVRAMVTAESARHWAVVLRVVAALVALSAVVGRALYVLAIDSNDSSSPLLENQGTPLRVKWAVFLEGIARPLALAGLLLASSVVVCVYAARLDLDIVQSDDDEFDREQGGTTE